MDWDAYPAIEERLVSELVTTIIRSEDASLDGWDETQALVRDIWEAEFEGVPESLIVEAAAPSSFQLLDCLDRVGYQNASSVREIAIGAVTEALNKRLSEVDDEVARARGVHEAFERLCLAGGDNAPYTTPDGWPCPTQMVDAFFTWVNEQAEYGHDHPQARLDAETVEVIQREGYNGFNEAHIRKVSVVSPVKNREVLQGLACWLEVEHSLRV